MTRHQGGTGRAAGIHLHVIRRRRAEGAPVILLHGNALTAGDWIASGVFGRLAARQRALARAIAGAARPRAPREGWGAVLRLPRQNPAAGDAFLGGALLMNINVRRAVPLQDFDRPQRLSHATCAGIVHRAGT